MYTDITESLKVYSLGLFAITLVGILGIAALIALSEPRNNHNSWWSMFMNNMWKLISILTNQIDYDPQRILSRLLLFLYIFMTWIMYQHYASMINTKVVVGSTPEIIDSLQDLLDHRTMLPTFIKSIGIT